MLCVIPLYWRKTKNFLTWHVFTSWHLLKHKFWHMLERLLTYSDIHADIYPAQLGTYLVTNLCRGQNLMLLNKFENNTKPWGKPHHWNLRRGGGAALAPGFRFGARRWWAQPDSFGGGARWSGPWPQLLRRRAPRCVRAALRAPKGSRGSRRRMVRKCKWNPRARKVAAASTAAWMLLGRWVALPASSWHGRLSVWTYVRICFRDSIMISIAWNHTHTHTSEEHKNMTLII